MSTAVAIAAIVAGVFTLAACGLVLFLCPWPDPGDED